MSAFEYVSPVTVEEAVGVLSAHAEARPLGGGQDMLLRVNRGALRGSLLVDLRRVAGLGGIERRESGVRIGAMTTVSEIAASRGIQRAFPALAEAAAGFGDAQLRNRATLGGSIATPQPEYDLPAVMLALDGVVHLVSRAGWRKVNAEEFFNSGLSRGDLVGAVVLPELPAQSGTAYEKMKHPARLTAVCGVAVAVSVANRKVSHARVAIAGATKHAVRLHELEGAITNGPGTAEAIDTALKGGVKLADGYGDFYASAEYRQHLAGVLAGRALKQALARAGA